MSIGVRDLANLAANPNRVETASDRKGMAIGSREHERLGKKSVLSSWFLIAVIGLIVGVLLGLRFVNII